MTTSEPGQMGDKFAKDRQNDPDSGFANDPTIARPHDSQSGPRILVRRANVEDARAIAEIAVAGWQAAYRGMLPTEFLTGLSVPARETAWKSMLESDPTGAAPAWVAEIDGRVSGFASSGPPRDGDLAVPAAEVYALYVLESRWRSGLGRGLMDAVAGHWRAAGVSTLVLWVAQGNGRARAFYEALGWRPDGSRQELELAGTTQTEVRYRRSGPA
jgi:GNAT superfamily N-acetyltransferase